MKKETLKNIFNFLERKDNRKTPFVWKLINNEPFTEDELNIKGDLELQGQDIQQLPDGIHVKNDLLLNSTPIKKLPKGVGAAEAMKYVVSGGVTTMEENEEAL